MLSLAEYRKLKPVFLSLQCPDSFLDLLAGKPNIHPDFIQPTTTQVEPWSENGTLGYVLFEPTEDVQSDVNPENDLLAQVEQLKAMYDNRKVLPYNGPSVSLANERDANNFTLSDRCKATDFMRKLSTDLRAFQLDTALPKTHESLLQQLEIYPAAWTIWSYLKKRFENGKNLHEFLWRPGGPISQNTWDIINSDEISENGLYKN